MGLPDPKFAPQRPDLTFLRRRTRPRVEPAPPAPAASPGIDYTRRPSGGPSGGSTGVDYTRPAAAPPASATPASPASPAAPSRGIDYTRHRSARRPDSPPPVTSSPPPPRQRTVQPLPEPPAAWARQHVVRVGGDTQRIMDAQHPTVTLTRVQSGVGELAMSAMVSSEVGDLRLGAVYQLRSGGSGIVAQAAGHRFGPSARRPVIAASRDEYEQLGVDLRQVADVERIAVLAFSESRANLDWTGTLVVTLEGGARLEVPLDQVPAARTAVLLTLYNMTGELVVRAELDPVDGDLREAARAYGFDRITWRDDRHPVD